MAESLLDLTVITIRIAPGVPATRLPTEAEWVDTSTRGRSIEGDRGRQDHELERTSAGQYTLVLDDRDRVLDPNNEDGPYFGLLDPMTWIQAKYRNTTKFTGYAEEFNVSWPGGPYAAYKGDAIVTIPCSDVFMLASRGDLSSYVASIVNDAPLVYYRMNDLAGTSRIVNVGSQQATGVTGVNMDLQPTPGAVSLGSLGGPLGTNRTVADFAGASNVWPLAQPQIRAAGASSAPAPTWLAFAVYAQGSRVTYGGNVYVALQENQNVAPFDNPKVWAWQLPNDGGATLWRPASHEMWIKPRTLTTGDGLTALYEYLGDNPAVPWRYSVGASGAIVTEWSGLGPVGFPGALVSASSPANLLTVGTWQHIAWTVEGSLIRWYKDGDFFGVTQMPVPSTAIENALNLAVLVVGAATNTGTGFDGQMAHFAVYPDSLDRGRIIAHITSTAEGIDEDFAGPQLNALLDSVGVPAEMRDIETGSTLMQAFEPSGSALDRMLAIAEDAEQGLLYATREGKFKFVSRDTLRDNTTSLATFGDAGDALSSGDVYGTAIYGTSHYGASITAESEIGYRALELSAPIQDLKTLVSVTREGGVEQVAWDRDEAEQKGVLALPLSGLTFASDIDAAALAGSLLVRRRFVRQRPTSFTIMGSDLIKATQIGLRDIGDVVTLRRRPPGGGSLIDIDSVIEGLHDTWSVGQPWVTQYRTDLGPDVGSWRVGVSELGEDTALGWGDPEPAGSDWIDSDAVVDGQPVNLIDWSILARRDPEFLRKAHAVRYYISTSNPQTSLTIPEIQRLKYHAGGAVSGTFQITPGRTTHPQLPYNPVLGQVDSAIFGSGSPFQGFVQVSPLATPLNNEGFFFETGGRVVGMDQGQLIGDNIIYQSGVLVAEHEALTAGTFTITVADNNDVETVYGPIPWNIDLPTMQALIPSAQIKTQGKQPSGLLGGFDVYITNQGNVAPLVITSNLVGDTLDVITIQDGDNTFVAPFFSGFDQNGQMIDTDNFGSPPNLGRVPGLWWVHGSLTFNTASSGAFDALLRKNGVDIFAKAGGVPAAAFGSTFKVEVQAEIAMEAGDFVQLGYTNAAATLFTGSNRSYIEAVWLGEA